MVASATGSRVLFDRGQRFADSLPEFTGNLTQHIQNVFFFRCLRLLLIQDVPGAAVLCAQTQYVLASEAGDRAIQNGRASGSLADFLGELRSQPRIRRLAHQSAASAGYALSETRLRKGDCSNCTANPWRSVPSNTGSPVVLMKSARTIVSLSVSFGVAWRRKIEVTCGDDRQHSGGGRSDHLPALGMSVHGSAGCRRRRAPNSVSRFRRWRSVRISDACW